MRIFCEERNQHQPLNIALVPTYEVDTDSRDIALCICIICKTQQQARLSYTGVPDKEKLEQVIVSGNNIVSRRLGRLGRELACCSHLVPIEDDLGGMDSAR